MEISKFHFKLEHHTACTVQTLSIRIPPYKFLTCWMISFISRFLSELGHRKIMWKISILSQIRCPRFLLIRSMMRLLSWPCKYCMCDTATILTYTCNCMYIFMIVYVTRLPSFQCVRQYFASKRSSSQCNLNGIPQQNVVLWPAWLNTSATHSPPLCSSIETTRMIWTLVLNADDATVIALSSMRRIITNFTTHSNAQWMEKSIHIQEDSRCGSSKRLIQKVDCNLSWQLIQVKATTLLSSSRV